MSSIPELLGGVEERSKAHQFGKQKIPGLNPRHDKKSRYSKYEISYLHR